MIKSLVFFSGSVSKSTAFKSSLVSVNHGHNIRLKFRTTSSSCSVPSSVYKFIINYMYSHNFLSISLYNYSSDHLKFIIICPSHWFSLVVLYSVNFFCMLPENLHVKGTYPSLKIISFPSKSYTWKSEWCYYSKFYVHVRS